MIHTTRAWASTLRRFPTPPTKPHAQAQSQTSPHTPQRQHPLLSLTIRRTNTTTSSPQPPPPPSTSQTSSPPPPPLNQSPATPAKPTLPNPSQSSIASIATLPSSQVSPASPKTIPGPLWLWLEPVYEPFRAYGRVQRRRPYLTQFASALVIYFVGDLVAQSIGNDDKVFDQGVIEDGCEEEEVGWAQAWIEERDWNRTGRALLIGGIAAVPGYRWFLWLSNSFNYRSKILSLTTKVTVNQLLFTPIFNSYFFGMQYLLSPPPSHASDSGPPRHSANDLVERLKATVPVSWVNSCKIWPAVTAFSFSFIPIEYRSIFGGVIAIGWQTYLSILNRRAEALERGEEEVVSQDKDVMRKVYEARNRKGEKYTA